MSFTVVSCEVRLSPEEADVGGEVRLDGRIATDPPCDLRGGALSIRDHTGAEVARLAVTGFDGTLNTTARATASVPTAPGSYQWSAVSVNEDGVVVADAAPSVFALTVRPHASRLAIWDVPTAVEVGQPFLARIGIKCSAGCDMTGRRFEVADHDGETVAAGVFTGEVWQDSEGLYVAAAELVAPLAEGLFAWTARVQPHDVGQPHGSAETQFRVCSVATADCTVRIETVDSERDTPLANMSVVMHPYRTMSDDSGVAEIRVARGNYTVFVSGRGYYPVRRELDVKSDVTARAPLQAEPPQSKDW